ncbi:phosphoenolpyruvate kinase [bacterium]|nr:phosphoenolpyruvate kinase [bacterium]
MSPTTLTPENLAPVVATLAAENRAFMRTYPGESDRRQAVHTVYGGAHLFKAESTGRIGEVALRSLREFAPDAAELTRILGETWEPAFAGKLYARIVEKLQREPVEDFRLDYEDGYGNREDNEEDAHAAQGARQVAAGLAAGTLPPFIGIRIKPFNEDLRERAIRTLDIFITTLIKETSGTLPPNFVVTLPKVQLAAQVTAAAALLTMLEEKLGLPQGRIPIEPMIETPQSIIDRHGNCPLLAMVEAAEGRCRSVHFGVYDYTASSGITAAYQAMGHPTCDFARAHMIVSLAGTGVHISDGATNILPVAPNRGDGLNAEQVARNFAAVHGAWKLGYDDNLHSLENGIYQGWDLHPAQLVARYAAVYSFFLQGLEAASGRLKAFVEKAALASLFGDVFDDAATGQGLLNFFLRGIACGAITEAEALETGLTLEEIRSRSFYKILTGRRQS